MSSCIVSVGVDLGGTWIRLQARDERRRKIRELHAPAITKDQLPAFLKNVFRRWKAHPKRLTVASRGVWTQTERRHLAGRLRPLAQHVSVMSDVEAAWLASFDGRTEVPGLRTEKKIKSRTSLRSAVGSPLARGLYHGRVPPKRPPRAAPGAPIGWSKPLSPQSSVLRPCAGIVIIAGTGSIAYGRDACGHAARAGGLGPLLGDEGSAFWIGREWLKRQRSARARRALFQEARAPHTAVRRIAAYAPRVIRQARNGQKAAREVVHLAQRHLAALVLQTAQSLHWKGSTIPVSAVGSVLENHWFQNGFWRALRMMRKHRWEGVMPHRDLLDAITYG